MDANSDLIKCPICFLIPEKEVYQCKNGHIICHKCSEGLKECPQCRVSIDGDNKNRCRVLEDLIGELKISCPFSGNGCPELIKKREMKTHKTSCKYGPTIPLCKLMWSGLSGGNCPFILNRGNLAEAVTHIQTKHGAWYMGDNTTTTSKRLVYDYFFEWNENSTASVLIQLKQPLNNLLFTIKIKDDFISWLFFDMSEAGNDKRDAPLPQVNLSLEEIPNVSWTLPLYPVLEFEEHFNQPLVKTYFPSLKKLRTNPGSNKCNFVIK